MITGMTIGGLKMAKPMDDFLLRALAAGMGIAVIAGPYGCLLVWRRMAFFGGALAHGSLLGVAIGLLLGISPTAALILFCIFAAILVALGERQRRLPSDTVLAIVAHTALALGLVVVSFLDAVRIDLMSYLVGDILAVSDFDLIVVGAGVVLALGGLALLWRPALAIIVNEDLARIDGVAVERVNAIMLVLTALVIAVAIKLVGILLVVALMVVPAGAARRVAQSPEQMIVWSAGCGVVAVILGLGASSLWDTQSGPSIVVAAAAVLAVLWLLPLGRRA